MGKKIKIGKQVGVKPKKKRAGLDLPKDFVKMSHLIWGKKATDGNTIINTPETATYSWAEMPEEIKDKPPAHFAYTEPSIPHNILQEAQSVVYGEREQSYGKVGDNFARIAKIWSGILDKEITKEQVGLCMIGVKVARECNKNKRDNLIDIAGYAATLEKMQNGG